MSKEKEELSIEQKSAAIQMFLNFGAGNYLAALKRMSNKLKNQLDDLQLVADDDIEVFVAGKKFDELTTGVELQRDLILAEVGLIRIEKQGATGLVSRIEFAIHVDDREEVAGSDPEE